jgi:hypothetical protein
VRVFSGHQTLNNRRIKKSRILLLEPHVLPQLQLDVITISSRQPQAHLKWFLQAGIPPNFSMSGQPRLWAFILITMAVLGHCVSAAPSDPVSSSSTPCSLSVSHPAVFSTSQIFHYAPVGPGAPQTKHSVVLAEIVLEFVPGRWLFDFAVIQYRPSPLR